MTTTTVSPIKQIEALNKRLVQAHELIEAGKVSPVKGLEAHYVVAARNGGVYMVNGVCTCPDAQHRSDIHHGWCKHKLAVELYKEQEDRDAASIEQSQEWAEREAELDLEGETPDQGGRMLEARAEAEEYIANNPPPSGYESWEDFESRVQELF